MERHSLTNGPILVATDFGARADRAIDRAILLGAQWNRNVLLVHALDDSEAEVFDKENLDRRMRAVLPEGIAGVDRVAFTYPEGPAPRALAQAADQAGASVVVMGPARHNSLRDYFLGTAVDYTLRNCEQPVLVVKQRPHRPYRSIFVATDFSKPSALAARLAMESFPEAELHVLHACHLGFESWQKADYVREDTLAGCRKRMEEFAASLRAGKPTEPNLVTHVAIGNAYDVVERVAREHEADLLVLGSHGESGFRHATIGSTANELLQTTLVDTLVVRTRD